MAIRFALAGNPNCGKTTLFNELTGSTAHVGNWPGVTVERREGVYKKGKEAIAIIDLPGIYSLSPYTPEEKVASEYIRNEAPDLVINIVDATNLERNLYLTTQILETGRPMIVALNMMDEVEQRGDRIDIGVLSKRLGVPVMPITAVRNKGVTELMERALAASKEAPPKPLIDPEEIAAITQAHADPYDAEAAVADLRYRIIGEMSAVCLKKALSKEFLTRSDKIDKVVTHRFFAIPLFILVMLLVFQITFGDPLIPGTGIPSPGVFIQGLTETLIEWIGGHVAGWLEAANAADWAVAVVMDGVIGGVGAVLSFIPQILMLFLFLSMLEDSGYMARAAFIMDRLLRRFGLSGKAFVPMLMGFGCSVPGIMATRTLENEQDRRLTILLTPFMSCGAKLPIYVVFAGALFAEKQGLAIACMYFLGILVAIGSGVLLKKTVFRGQAAPFIMELPAYRFPTFKNTMRHMWDKGKEYTVRAGTVILASVIVISFLKSFSWSFQMVDDPSLSIIGSIGRAIQGFFTPLGFATWQAGVAVLTGFLAKEDVVATLGTLYGGADGELDASNAALLAGIAGAFTPASALSFMTFNLLAMPCMAAVGAMHQELGSWKRTLFTVGYQTAVAYVVAMLVYWVASIAF